MVCLVGHSESLSYITIFPWTCINSSSEQELTARQCPEMIWQYHSSGSPTGLAFRTRNNFLFLMFSIAPDSFISRPLIWMWKRRMMGWFQAILFVLLWAIPIFAQCPLLSRQMIPGFPSPSSYGSHPNFPASGYPCCSFPSLFNFCFTFIEIKRQVHYPRYGPNCDSHSGIVVFSFCSCHNNAWHFIDAGRRGNRGFHLCLRWWYFLRRVVR